MNSRKPAMMKPHPAKGQALTGCGIAIVKDFMPKPRGLQKNMNKRVPKPEIFKNSVLGVERDHKRVFLQPRYLLKAL